MRSLFTLTFIVAAAFAIGCGQSPQSEEVNTESVTTEETPGFTAQRPAKQYMDPRESVNDFLIAVKSGDDKTATALLSTAAQREAWTNGLAISGEGFPDAQFKVSEVEYLNEDTEAHVMSVWENKTNYSDQKSFQCVWLLRSEPHGWCIYGMATKFLDHVEPVKLNFENQAEMQKRQQWAQEEIRKFAELQRHQQQADALAKQQGTHGPQAPGTPNGQMQQGASLQGQQARPAAQQATLPAQTSRQ